MNKAFALLFGFVLFGCNGTTEKEIDHLKKENDRLKAELEECKYGAEKLLAETNYYFEQMNFSKAKEKINLLLEKYPLSKEATNAAQLLKKVNFAIAEEKRKLEEQIKKEQEEKERNINKALSNLVFEYNEFSDATYYRDKSSPGYVNRNGFFLTFSHSGKKGESKPRTIYLKIQYHSDDWLFINDYQFAIDGKNYSLSPEKIERDHGEGGMIWEWCSINLNYNKDAFAIVKAIINSRTAKIRFNGSQYYDVKVISSSEKSALKNVLLAFEALGGTPN